jgi:hypothetical protein
MLAMLSLGGATRAAEFDEKMKAPMMTTTGEFQLQSQPMVVKYRALRADNPEQLVRDASLARQKFDLRWQLLRAVESRKPLEDAAALGLDSQGDGSYRIDLDTHPEWEELPDTIAGLLSHANLDVSEPALLARGFRPEDVVTLKDYVKTHDADAAAKAAVVPITLEFAQKVRKFDKIKQPVPQTMVESFYYQRARIASEYKRRWTEDLLQQFDAQRRRILLSTFTEGGSYALWAPSDLEAASAELMAEMRKPDFEARVKAEVKGVAR